MICLIIARPQISLAMMLALTLCAGYAISVVMTAVDPWPVGTFVGVWTVLFSGLVAGLQQCGRSRVFWLGFTMAGSLYLLIGYSMFFHPSPITKLSADWWGIAKPLVALVVALAGGFLADHLRV